MILIIIIYIALILLNGLACYYKMRVKTIEWLSFLLLLFLMGGNTFNDDYEDYFRWYETQNSPILMEPAYDYVSSLFFTFGFGFEGFRFIIYLLSLAMMWVAIKRLVDNFHLILLGYLTYCFVIDTIQIRNIIAMSILMLAITFLAEGKKLVFVIATILASLFHYSFFLFLPLVFYDKAIDLINKNMLVIICLPILMCVIFTLDNYFASQLSMIIGLLWADSKSVYVDLRSSNFVYLVFPYLFFFIAYQTRSFLSMIEEVSDEQQQVYSNYSDIILFASVFFVFLSPILILSQDSLRIVRDLNVELLLAVTIFYTMYKQLNADHYEEIKECIGNKEIIYIVSLSLLLVLWMAGGQNWHGYTDIFDNNLFLDMEMFADEIPN